MRIFDRWGNQLMERQNIPLGVEEAGWDGTVNSEIVAPGVYVYQLTITYRDGSSRTYSGDVYVDP